MALAAFAVVFFTALLGMAGPLPLRRAALSAAGLALVVSGLLALASLRFHTAGAVFGSAIPVLAMLVLTRVFSPASYQRQASTDNTPCRSGLAREEPEDAAWIQAAARHR